MASVFGKLIRRTADAVALHSGLARRRFISRMNCIRVLTYHGVVPDDRATRPWVPSHFLPVSQFERQMEMLEEFRPVVPLGQALKQIATTDAVEPMVCLTFDDGTADNVRLVLPILKRFGYRATFFLATGLVDRGAMLSCNMIRLLADLHGREELDGTIPPVCRQILAEPGFHKQLARHDYQQELEQLWLRNSRRVDPEAVDALRMMTWDEVLSLRDAGMEIGAHTVNHVILGREGLVRRRSEMTGSVARVQEMLDIRHVPFSYPNGEVGDFNETDQQVLATLNVPYAVKQTPGWITPNSPRLALPRNSISRHCSDSAFLAHVLGLRDTDHFAEAQFSGIQTAI